MGPRQPEEVSTSDVVDAKELGEAQRAFAGVAGPTRGH